MDIDELKTSLKRERESGNFRLQAIFNRHIKEFEQLKNEGYSYSGIIRTLDLNISLNYYTNLISRARTHINKDKGNIKSDNNRSHLANNENEKESHDIAENKTSTVIKTKEESPPPHLELKHSVEEWNLKTGVKLSERMLFKLEKSNLTPQKICDLNLTTATQIINYVTETESKTKYK
ncbi:hypothetical protein [uncultured Shewanella sp.]|uniref:hypothetical protein n=1 Tax=uncultured Shewanella sp. TaxID=173975 RepID=UPI0026051420|nr:hypothetical protein [uncultured Shewanella sp.]